MKKYPLLKHRRTRLHHLGEEQKKMGNMSYNIFLKILWIYYHLKQNLL